MLRLLASGRAAARQGVVTPSQGGAGLLRYVRSGWWRPMGWHHGIINNFGLAHPTHPPSIRAIRAGA